MPKEAAWTWLIYMAGDNNLEGAGREDLKEMKKVGSSSALNIIVQFDTERNRTTRYRVEKNRLAAVQKMPGVDSGDPKVLSDFIKWGMKNYPAQHYLVNVWNHGGGWENLPDDYDYNSIRGAKPRLVSRLKGLRRSIFRTTVNKIHKRNKVDRAIALDCGSQDYLDNQELRSAIAGALPDEKKIDILGFDACLMNMLEICYEMKDTTNFIVGSEETEPGAGWPYASILKDLARNPGTTPAELAKTISTRYGEWYQKNGDPVHDGSATQSSLDIAQIKPVADAVNELADAFLKNLDGVAPQVTFARSKTQKFYYPEYIDLGDFANQLIKRLSNNQEIVSAATKITRSLSSTSGVSFVIANSTWGSSVARATGISIYFPFEEDYSRDYVDLLFSRDTKWNEFLESFHKLQ